MLTITVQDRKGHRINNATRKFPDPTVFKVGQSISIEVAVNDIDLSSYLDFEYKHGKRYMVHKGSGECSFNVSCTVQKVEHSVTLQRSSLNTIVVVEPIDKIHEYVMFWAFDTKRCDPKLNKAVKSTSIKPKK